MKIIEIIKELNLTNSQNEKIAILNTHKDNELLKKVFYYTYNNLYNYYTKSVESVTNPKENVQTLESIFPVLDRIRTRKITGANAKRALQNVVDLMSIDDTEVVNLILNRNLKCGVTATIANKVWGKNFIFKFKVALASGEKDIEKSIVYPVYCQKKSDGRRSIIKINPDKSVQYFTRSGKEDEKLSDNLEFAKEILKFLVNVPDNGCILDCEAVIAGENGREIDRKTGNGILNRKEFKDPNMVNRVRFVVWDIVDLKDFENAKGNTPYSERFDLLVKLFDHYKGNLLKLIPSQIVESYDEARKIADEYISNGYEGAMVKNMNAIYEGKRVHSQIKIKDEKNCDLKVVEWIEGTGVFEGYLGALKCESKCGKLVVNVGTGFSFAQRGLRYVDDDKKLTESVETQYAKDKIIGSIVEIKYNEIIGSKSKDTYSLFLPRIIEIRSDKTEADSLEKILSEQK